MARTWSYVYAVGIASLVLMFIAQAAIIYGHDFGLSAPINLLEHASRVLGGMFVLLGVVLWIRGVSLLAGVWDSFTPARRSIWALLLTVTAVLGGYLTHRQFATKSHLRPARADSRWFYKGFALAAGATVFAGFAPTYYLSLGSSFRPIVHVHAVLFTLWILLFYVQVSLAREGLIATHRRLGVAGAALAAALLVVGVVTAMTWTRLSLLGLAVGAADPRAFLLISLGDMVVFALFVGLAVHFRREPATHKRWMVLATIGLLHAAVGRLGFPGAHEPAVFFAVTDLFLLAAIVGDWMRYRRVHAVYAFGGAFLVAAQYLRIWLGQTDAWRSIAVDWVG